jgi:hypothetical protein
MLERKSPGNWRPLGRSEGEGRNVGTQETWEQAKRNSCIGFLSISDAAQELLRSSLTGLPDSMMPAASVTSRCEILLRRLSL